MDIVLVSDKTKVVDNTGKYKIIQKEDLNILNFEEFSKSNMYIFLDFEFVTIKKELPTDANFYFYDLTFLPIYRLDVSDFKSLLDCFSLQEIIEVLRETEVKKQEISKEQVLVSYKNNLAFLKDDYFDYYLKNLEHKEPIDGKVPSSTFFLLDIKRNILYWCSGIARNTIRLAKSCSAAVQMMLEQAERKRSMIWCWWPVTGQNWMNLFINSDCKYDNGWYGYNYIINRYQNGNAASIERFADGTWATEKVGDAEFSANGKIMQIKVSKSLLNIKDEFHFKWADNSVNDGNIMEFIDKGDVAPNDRFNYIYKK